MARTLKQTVFAGGVIYAAGTPEADVEADVPDQFWDGEPEAGTGDVKGYSTWKVDRLKAEVEARNDARGEDEPQIEVEEPGNKPQLVAALEADDQEQ